jgi:hypothetical protein
MNAPDESTDLPPVGIGGDGRVVQRKVGRFASWGGWVDDPGEFDIPPSEPVELIGDVPWELRDDGEGADESSDDRGAP